MTPPRWARWLAFVTVLRPIIRANYRERMAGRAPDEWHPADALAVSWGYFTIVNLGDSPMLQHEGNSNHDVVETGRSYDRGERAGQMNRSLGAPPVPPQSALSTLIDRLEVVAGRAHSQGNELCEIATRIGGAWPEDPNGTDGDKPSNQLSRIFALVDSIETAQRHGAQAISRLHQF